MLKKRSQIEVFVVLSLILHGILVATMLRIQPLERPNSRTVEVVFLDPPLPRPERKQFVTDPDLKPLTDALEKLKEKADFLSRETRRVKEQTVARRSGQTQNRPPPTRFPKPNENFEPEPEWNGRPSLTGPSRVAEKVMLSESTLAEYIPEVKQGGFTALNTDQFIYYTFYARINEQIRNRWVSNLRAFANQAGPHELNRLSQREQITELEILLDREGRFLEAIVHRRSENDLLDAAAAVAIQNAAPFLNPPSEIVKEDGTIRLYYQFHVHWRPQYLAGPRRSGH